MENNLPKPGTYRYDKSVEIIRHRLGELITKRHTERRRSYAEYINLGAPSGHPLELKLMMEKEIIGMISDVREVFNKNTDQDGPLLEAQYRAMSRADQYSKELSNTKLSSAFKKDLEQCFDIFSSICSNN